MYIIPSPLLDYDSITWINCGEWYFPWREILQRLQLALRH